MDPNANGMNPLSYSNGKYVHNFTSKETNGKEKFSVLTEEGKIIQLETFPKKPVEIKSMFKYSVNDHWKIISLVLHVMSTKLFQAFKNPILTWLKMNKYFMNKTIFKSSKDTNVCIGNLTNLNPFQINQTQYQESINLLMEGAAQEKVALNAKYLKTFNMTAEIAKYDVQLRLN
eukprot:12564442-Ditylum_brightwellii.AAC.1